MARGDHAVVRFIRDVLGCGCPDEVLRTIRIDRPWHASEVAAELVRIDVGGRLLVWLLAVGGRPTDLAGLVTSAATVGLAERDRMAFNRLRLVLASPDPSEIAGPALEAFDAHRWPDDRIHLHVVDLRSVPAAIRPIEQGPQS
jgi:hypothetical protein